jgi:hypothetical protein
MVVIGSPLVTGAFSSMAAQPARQSDTVAIVRAIVDFDARRRIQIDLLNEVRCAQTDKVACKALEARMLPTAWFVSSAADSAQLEPIAASNGARVRVRPENEIPNCGGTAAPGSTGNRVQFTFVLATDTAAVRVRYTCRLVSLASSEISGGMVTYQLSRRDRRWTVLSLKGIAW